MYHFLLNLKTMIWEDGVNKMIKTYLSFSFVLTPFFNWSVSLVLISLWNLLFVFPSGCIGSKGERKAKGWESKGGEKDSELRCMIDGNAWAEAFIQESLWNIPEYSRTESLCLEHRKQWERGERENWRALQGSGPSNAKAMERFQTSPYRQGSYGGVLSRE